MVPLTAKRCEDDSEPHQSVWTIGCDYRLLSDSVVGPVRPKRGRRDADRPNAPSFMTGSLYHSKSGTARTPCELLGTSTVLLWLTLSRTVRSESSSIALEWKTKSLISSCVKLASIPPAQQGKGANTVKQRVAASVLLSTFFLFAQTCAS